jgi:hypothetical protein
MVTIQAKPSQFEDVTPVTKALDGDISVAQFQTEIRSVENIDQRLQQLQIGEMKIPLCQL